MLCCLLNFPILLLTNNIYVYNIPIFLFTSLQKTHSTDELLERQTLSEHFAAFISFTYSTQHNLYLSENNSRPIFVCKLLVLGCLVCYEIYAMLALLRLLFAFLVLGKQTFLLCMLSTLWNVHGIVFLTRVNIC